MRKPDVHLDLVVTLTLTVEEAQGLLDALYTFSSEHPTDPIYQALASALDRVPTLEGK